MKATKNPSLQNKNTNWEEFRENLTYKLQLNISLKTAQELDEATNYFITTLQNCIWETTPTVHHKTRKELNIPRETLNMVRENRRARAKRIRNPIDIMYIIE